MSLEMASSLPGLGWIKAQSSPTPSRTRLPVFKGWVKKR
jgi:hypothetical protein